MEIQRGDIRQFQSTAVEQQQGSEAISGVGQAVLRAGEQFAYMKGQEIQTNVANKISLAGIEMYQATSDLKTKYIDNPFDPEFAKEQQQIYEDIKQKYGTDFQTLGSNQWEQAFSKLKTGYDVETNVWGIKQQRENTINNLKFVNENNIKLAAQMGQKNDLTGFLAFTEGSLDSIYQSYAAVNGEAKSKLYTQAYKEDMATSFMSGKIISDPVGALELLDSKEITSVIKDPTTISKLKTAAMSQYDTQIKTDDFNRRYQYSKSKGELGILAMRGMLGLDELEKFLADPNMTEKDKDFFLKQSGYTKKEAGGGEPKLDKLQKDDIFANLLYKGSNLISGDEFENIKPLKMRNAKLVGTRVNLDSRASAMMQKVSDYQTEVNEAYAKGYITESKVRELTSNYVTPVSEFLKANLRPLEEKGSGQMLGFSQLKKYTKDLEGMVEDKSIKKETAMIENGLLYSTYYNELKKEAQKRQMKSIYDFEGLSSAEQQKVYGTAAENAIEYTKRYGNSPAYWFKRDYSLQAEAIQMTLPKEQANEAMNNVARQVYKDPKLNVNEVTNKEMANQVVKPQAKKSSGWSF